MRHKYEILRGHCDAVGRNFDDITRSTSIENAILLHAGEDPQVLAEPVFRAQGSDYEHFASRAQIETPEQMIARIQGLADAGVNYVLLNFPRAAYDHEQLHRFATEVAPHFL